MKKNVSGAIEIDGFQKVDINNTLKKLQKFDSNIKEVKVFFTGEPGDVKCIAELLFKGAGLRKKIIKKGMAGTPSKALKKALKKAKKKLISIVVKKASAA